MIDFHGLGRIIVITNPYAEIILNQAHEMKSRGHYPKALEMYDQVLEIDPGNAQAFHSKGDVYDSMGKFEDAIVCYNSALLYDPCNVETWYKKGVTLKKMGCADDSVACLHQGVSLAYGNQ